MNRNAARYAVPTENGAAALGFEGATHFMTGSGTRGGALAAMSQHLVGSRGADAVRHAKAVSGLAATAAATSAAAAAAALGSKRPDCRRGAVVARLKAHKARKLQQKRQGAKAGSGGGPRTGLGQTQLESFIAQVFAESETLDDAAAATDNAVDLFCMVFDLADIREGRGERALFVWALLALLPRFPRTVVATLRLVPEFASWCTLNLVADEAAARTRAPDTPREHLPLFTSVNDEIVRLYVAQLRADEAALAADADAHVSLAGKWAPGMASRFERVSRLGTAIRDALFPTGVTALQQTLADDGDAAAADRARRCANFASMRYRRLLSRLRQRIGVVERLMSAKRWGDIVPEHVPSAANMKYRKALLNKGVDGHGVRDAADAGRVLCAERFKAAAKATVAVAAAAALAAAQGVAAPAPLTKTLKGARNQPHKLVEAVMPGHHAHCLGADEAELVDAMWAALVTELRAKGTMKPSLAIVDVSGSMSGLPMTVAVALGLLLSELAPPPWTGRMMTFAGTPAWFTCPEGATTLQARVAATMGMHWNVSTNFARALELVLTTAVEGGLPANALPEVLFVLTDMQFDAAGGMDPHAAALVRRRFAEYNYTPPHIVFWNLRATDTPIYQAETSDPGVSFMSGFSPQMFADFLSNGVLASGSTVTPWETVHARLNRPRLLPVRRVCESVGEGVMAGYVVVDASVDASTESAESE